MMEKYKLPEGWRWVRLGEVCEIIKGKKPELFKERTSDDMLPYLTAEVIRSGVTSAWCKVNGKNSVCVNENEIIIITDGSNSGDVFVGHKGILASTMGKLRIDETKIVKDYIYFFIKMNFKNLNEPKRGSAIPHLEKEIFFNLNIPLPPIPVQRRIASYLRELMQQVERARNACEKQLEAAKALPSAYLREVFESEEAKKWERKRLGEVCEVEKGKTPKEHHYATDGVRIIKYRDIMDNGKINWKGGFRSFVSREYTQDLKVLHPNSTLIGADAHDPCSIGKKIAFVESIPKEVGECYYSGELIAINVRNEKMIDHYWPFLWFRSGDGYRTIQRYVEGVHLNKGQAILMPIPLPPLSEQRRIASYLREKMAYVEKLITSIEKQLEAINALPQAILRKAFRGEL